MIDNSDVSTAGLTTSHQAVHHLAPVGNIGFAAAHNRLMDTAFSFGTDIYIAANPDGAFHPGAIEALVQMMQAQDYRALIDAIQFPVEHPKIYDPVTFETPWASGACLAIPHDIFKKIRGFDDTFFMYCEDVDCRGAPVRLLLRCASVLALSSCTQLQTGHETLKPCE